MTRAYDDTTSRCKTCTYFESTPNLPTGFGYCNYQSVPAWVHKHLVPRDDHRVMAGVDGLDCWLHNKRATTELPIDPKRLLRGLAVRSGNFCRLCGRDHNMPGTCAPRGSDPTSPTKVP